MKIAFVGDSLTVGVPGASHFAILRPRLAGHTLINLGKGNDTVVSLYRRLVRRGFEDHLDLAFLWIGVNDVSANDSWSFRLMNALRGQRRSRSLAEFRDYYDATLALLAEHADRVIAVSPLLKGEDLDSDWNARLAELTSEIETLTERHHRAEFLDLRARLSPRLERRPPSRYLPTSLLRVALDAMTLRTTEQVDRRSAERGLCLTLDGVHLNGTGARLVAEAFLEVIARHAEWPTG